MKTVGEILKQEREKQDKTILQIHRETKIPQKTLEALEADNFTSLPPATFVKGFIRVYAQTLDLEPKKLLAIFRRDWQESEKGEIVPKGLSQPLNPSGFGWTPKTAFILIISTLGLLFLAYIGLQLTRFLLPPKLSLESPLEGQKIEQEMVKIVGQASKDSSVYVNNQLIETDEEGKFSYQLKLFPGENRIEVKAVDRRDKETLLLRTIEAVDKSK